MPLPNGKEPDLVIELPEVMIADWSPAPEHDGEPTQVHLIIDLPDIATFITRFRSRAGLQRFIDDLSAARDRVFQDGK